MKSNILAAIFVLASVSPSFAHTKKPVAVATREISTFQNVKRIIISNNVKIVLVADDSYPFITVTGDADLLDAVTVTNKGDEVVISSIKNLKNRKILIHVPVNDLAYMELKSGSAVAVQGVIPCTNMVVVVNSDAHLAIRYSGKATIKPADDCEFVYEREESTQVAE